MPVKICHDSRFDFSYRQEKSVIKNPAMLICRVHLIDNFCIIRDNVPEERLELSRILLQRLLRPQRLPISPSGHCITQLNPAEATNLVLFIKSYNFFSSILSVMLYRPEYQQRKFEIILRLSPLQADYDENKYKMMRKRI